MARHSKRSRPTSVSSTEPEPALRPLNDLARDSTQDAQDSFQNTSERRKDSVSSKKAKFDHRYATATTSPEDVLGAVILTTPSQISDCRL
jgi:hypothetical protein